MGEKYKIKPAKEHPLINVWNDFPQFLQNNKAILPPPSMEELIGKIFALGEFYYYTINFADSTIVHPHQNILKMHGLQQYPQHLSEIIDLIHPEDMPFVSEAERMAIEKIKEIDGFSNIQELKSSYCFRMKTGSGNYEMFHHQALHSQKDKYGKLVQALNIHTNIQHITQQNPYTVLVAGIGGRNDFHHMEYKKNGQIETADLQKLTKRETEILTYIGRGFSGKEISEKLALSEHTVHTHRKNILIKTHSKNIKELVRKAFEWSLV